MKTDVQTLLIVAEVSEAASDDSRADSSLTRASGLQETILARSRWEERRVFIKGLGVSGQREK